MLCYHRPFSIALDSDHVTNYTHDVINFQANESESAYQFVPRDFVDYQGNASDIREYYYMDGSNNTNYNSDSIIPEVERILLTRVVIGICAFGVIGNIATLVLLIKRRWRHNRERSRVSDRSVANADILGLISLSMSDLFFCVSVLPHAAAEINKYTFESHTFTLYFSLVDNAVINTFIMASTWLTVSMTINRYAHLCHPILGLRYFGSRFMGGAIIISTLFSLAFNLPRFWFYEIVQAECYDTANEEQFSVYGKGAGLMKNSKIAEAVYQWLYFFLGISIPLLTLAYCNCRIIHAVYHSMAVEQRRNRERNLITKVLICIVIFYLLLVSPAEIIKFFSSKVEIHTEHIHTYNFAVTILNTFQAINFSCNFIPYLVLDKYVRSCFTGHSTRSRQEVNKAGPMRSRNQYESVSIETNITSMSDGCTKSCLRPNNPVHMYNLRSLRKPTE